MDTKQMQQLARQMDKAAKVLFDGDYFTEPSAAELNGYNAMRDAASRLVAATNCVLEGG